MYTTEAKIENYIQTDIDDSISGYVTDWIAWVTAYIDRYTGTSFGGTSTVKYYDGFGGRRVFIDNFTTITAVEFMNAESSAVQDTLAVDDYQLYPLNDTTKNEIRLNPYSGSFGRMPIGSRRIKVTGTFGVGSTVPPDIEMVATAMVGDIVRQASSEAKTVKGEQLGEYSVTFDDIGGFLKTMYKDVLDSYRVPVL